MARLATIWGCLMFVVAGGAWGCATGGDEPIGVDEAEVGRNACELVRCFAVPECESGQHLIYTPEDCCGRCVGPDEWADRCELVLCAAVACPDGQQRIYSPGRCCGVCVPQP